MIRYCFCVLDAGLTIFLIYKFLDIKIDKRYVMLAIITAIEFCLLDSLLLTLVYFSITSVYLNKVNYIDYSDAYLFILLTEMIYLVSGLIKNAFLPIYVDHNANYFERTVIHFIMVVFIYNLFSSKKQQYIKKSVIVSLSLGTLSTILLVVIFAKLSLGNELTSIEIIAGSCATAFICWMLIRYYLLFNHSFDEIDKINDKYKYQIFNQSKLTSTYKKSNQMNHNLKYTLLNLKLLLNNQEYDKSIDYINSNLNIIDRNQSVYTNNPYFDYTINNFENNLAKLNLNCNKNICISENSIFGNEEYSKRVNEYFVNQMELIAQMQPKSISLMIQEKGDFLIIKTIYLDYCKPSVIKGDYKYENDLLITSLILEDSQWM